MEPGPGTCAQGRAEPDWNRSKRFWKGQRNEGHRPRRRHKTEKRTEGSEWPGIVSPRAKTRLRKGSSNFSLRGSAEEASPPCGGGGWIAWSAFGLQRQALSPGEDRKPAFAGRHSWCNRGARYQEADSTNQRIAVCASSRAPGSRGVGRIVSRLHNSTPSPLFRRQRGGFLKKNRKGKKRRVVAVGKAGKKGCFGKNAYFERKFISSHSRSSASRA
jgi:hypothetical protein